MSITKVDKNGNEIYLTDPNGNELGKEGKIIGGVLLIAATIMTLILIVAHWPDKLPPLGTVNVCTKYQYKWFDIRYLGSNGENTDNRIIIVIKKNGAEGSDKKNDNVNGDSTVSEEAGTFNMPGEVEVKVTGQNIAKKESDSTKDSCGCTVISGKKITNTIDLNTLILLLVALSGFLGNIIHIGSSFTNFVGGGKFRRSWLLWYFVKPFTAAALAVGVYIIFRAGFLNSAEATASVNLYGVISIAILAGLYTDMATLKLKEVFGVIFNTNTVRPDPLGLPKIKITSVNPKQLPLNIETAVVLSGSGFENRILKVEIDKQEIKDIEIQPNSFAFIYTATSLKPALVIYDEKGVELLKYDLITMDSIPSTAIAITDISPIDLKLNKANDITITGTGLDSTILTVKIGDTIVAETDISKSSTSLKFSYTPLVAGDVIVVVKDGNDIELFNKTLMIS